MRRDATDSRFGSPSARQIGGRRGDVERSTFRGSIKPKCHNERQLFNSTYLRQSSLGDDGRRSQRRGAAADSRDRLSSLGPTRCNLVPRRVLLSFLSFFSLSLSARASREAKAEGSIAHQVDGKGGGENHSGRFHVERRGTRRRSGHKSKASWCFTYLILAQFPFTISPRPFAAAMNMEQRERVVSREKSA